MVRGGIQGSGKELGDADYASDFAEDETDKSFASSSNHTVV